VGLCPKLWFLLRRGERDDRRRTRVYTRTHSWRPFLPTHTHPLTTPPPPHIHTHRPRPPHTERRSYHPLGSAAMSMIFLKEMGLSGQPKLWAMSRHMATPTGTLVRVWHCLSTEVTAFSFSTCKSYNPLSHRCTVRGLSYRMDALIHPFIGFCSFKASSQTNLR
jgi:hypothetical protein